MPECTYLELASIFIAVFAPHSVEGRIAYARGRLPFHLARTALCPDCRHAVLQLSLIHISEPTRRTPI
eukprot:5407225-Pleurochrysis_carterae.AAC.1